MIFYKVLWNSHNLPEFTCISVYKKILKYKYLKECVEIYVLMTKNEITFKFSCMHKNLIRYEFHVFVP